MQRGLGARTAICPPMFAIQKLGVIKLHAQLLSHIEEATGIIICDVMMMHQFKHPEQDKGSSWRSQKQGVSHIPFPGCALTGLCPNGKDASKAAGRQQARPKQMAQQTGRKLTQ